MKVKKYKSKICICVVVSRFNDFITQALYKSCLEELKRSGLKDGQMMTVWVPGAFEIPLVASVMSRKRSVDAVICLGAVIRGETYHFETVANETVRGIMNVALTSGKPVIMGVLTTDTIVQAQKRAQDSGGINRGREAARSALEMIKCLNEKTNSRP